MTEVLGYLRGGGVVMVPIVGLSVWMWSLVVQKALEFWREGGGGVELQDALDYLRDRTPLKGRGPKVLLLEKLKVMGRLGLREVEVVLREVELELSTPVRTVKVLASVAPLLGLLGTVLGMISTFWAISIHGTGSPKALAAGISEALITTVSGLLVSIPGLFAYALLSRKASKVVADLEEFAARVAVRARGS